MQEIPASFLALYRDARGRLREAASAVFARYDWCEDLALQASEAARGLALSLGGGETEILARLRQGLLGDGTESASVSPEEAWWIEVRVAELLSWPHPDLPQATERPRAER